MQGTNAYQIDVIDPTTLDESLLCVCESELEAVTRLTREWEQFRNCDEWSPYSASQVPHGFAIWKRASHRIVAVYRIRRSSDAGAADPA